MSLLFDALDYLDRGFSIIPMRLDAKEGAIPWKKYQTQKPTEEEIYKWFGGHRAYNIGIVTGALSGLCVVDLDSEEAFQFAKDHGFPEGPKVKSNKGYHLYCRYEEGVRNWQKRGDFPGIDMRGEGGAVMAPPSIHPESGKPYEFVKGLSLSDMELAKIPEVLLRACKNKPKPSELIRGVSEGSRNDSLARLCGSWIRHGLSFGECMENAELWNARNTPPLPDREVEATIKSIWNKHEREEEMGDLVVPTGTETDELKEQLRRIRLSKVQASEKRRTISRFVLESLHRMGVLYRTEEVCLYYFANASLTLYDVESVDFRYWINTTFGINGSEPDWKFLIEDVKAHIVDQGILTEIYRFASFKEGLLYVYCGEQRMYRLDGEKIARVNNGTDRVVFLDHDMEPISAAEQWEPDTVKHFLVQANFKGGTSLTADDERALYLIWIYACFFESILPTKAILLLYGVKGSGKTSNLRVLLRALFGKKAQVAVINTEKEDSFLAAIAANYILCIDNVDGRVQWLPNRLATAATGGELVLRKLFTSNELMRIRARCFLALTSRQPDSFTRDDVADRLCILSVDRFPSFRPEKEILDRIGEMRPAIWGELLAKLNEIVRRLKTHKPKTMDHRLADFADLATVIGPVIGVSKERVMEILHKMDREKNEFTLENNPVYAGLCAWVEAGGMGHREHITTAELFEEVKKAWDGMPVRSTKSFGRYLKNLLPELETYFDVEGPFKVRGNRKAWSIREKTPDKSHSEEILIDAAF